VPFAELKKSKGNVKLLKNEVIKLQGETKAYEARLTELLKVEAEAKQADKRLKYQRLHRLLLSRTDLSACLQGRVCAN
jgi:hypothetical protein